MNHAHCSSGSSSHGVRGFMDSPHRVGLILRALGLTGAFFALWASPFVASASMIVPSGTVAIEAAAGGVRMIDGFGGATFVGRNVHAGPGLVNVVERHALRLPGVAGAAGPLVELAAKRALPYAAIAKTLYDAIWPEGINLDDFDDLFNGPGPGRDMHPSAQGGVAVNQKNPGRVGDKWRCNGDDKFIGATPYSACSAYWKEVDNTQRRLDQAATNSQPSWSFTTSYQYPPTCTVYADNPLGAACNGGTVTKRQCHKVTGSCDVGTSGFGSAAQKIGSTVWCEPYIDALDPKHSVTSEYPPDANGECKSGSYIRATIPQIIRQLEGAEFRDPEIVPRVVEDLIDKGRQSFEVPGGRELSGPSSATSPGATTTTTTPEGTTTTTTNTTHIYNYEGDTVIIDNRTETKTTNNNGDVIRNEIKVEEGKKTDVVDDCKINPDRLGCGQLGDAPTDSVPKSTRTVSMDPVDIGVSGSCPPPVPLPGGKFFSYQPLCDGLIFAKPLVLLLSAFSAGMIVIAALRS